MVKPEFDDHRPHLITTKFQPPASPPQLVARGHLLEQLNAGRRRRLTLIHGPAGFGKTTLVVQWRDLLLQDGAAVAWLSMGREDNALDRWLSYIVEAIRMVESSIGRGLVALLEAQPEHAAPVVLADLVNELKTHGRSLYLILDDYHLVTERAIHDAIGFLIDYAPANFQLVITSRSRPPLPLTKLRVGDQLNEIDADELRFSADECAVFIRDANTLSLSQSAVQSLWRSTEGWIAALQLALLSLRASDDREHLIRSFSGKHHAVGDYLAENVLDSLPQETLDFLTATSILDRLCGDLCAAVSGHRNSQAILEQLERQNLFIRPLDDERCWYRYHHLFADFLQRRLERDRPECMAALQRAASDWFAQQGFTDEAVRHALAANDVERAIALVERDAMMLVEHSAMSTLLALVHKLPSERLRDRVPLQLAIAWGNCLIHRPAEARQALDHVMNSLSAQRRPEHDGLAAEARVVQACISIYADRLEGVEEQVQPCIAHSSDHSAWVVAVASNILTFVLIHRFDYEGAIRLQAWARQFHDRTQGPFSGIYGRCFAGIAAQALGRLGEGAGYFRDALRLAHGSAGRYSHAARLTEALLGQLLYETNELEEAEKLLEESRALGLEGGVVDFSIATYVSASRLRAQQGDNVEAHRILDEGAHAARQLGFARLAAAMLCERVRVHLALGDVAAAAAMFDADFSPTAADAADDGDGVAQQSRELRLLAWAQLRCAQGAAAEAVPILSGLLAHATRHRRACFAVVTRVQLALAMAQCGDRDAGRDLLAQALHEGQSIGMCRVFLDEGPRLATLAAAVAARAEQQDVAPPLGRVPYANSSAIPLADRLATSSTPSSTKPRSGEWPSSTVAGDSCEALKEREIEILVMLDQGRSNKEIARVMAVGVNTVKWYLKSVYAKLGVASRTQAVYQARRNGLLQSDRYPPLQR